MSMVVNIMGQLGFAWYLDIWLSIILDASVKAFLDEINIWVNRF